MSLTPEDVLNKTFSTTQFRRGYDEREVDDFLDEIVATLRQLGKDLKECRSALGSADAPGGDVKATLLSDAAVDVETETKADGEQVVSDSEPEAVADGAPEAVGESEAETDWRSGPQDATGASLEQPEGETVLDQSADVDTESAVELLDAESAPLESSPTASAQASSPIAGGAAELIALAQRVHDEHVAEGERTRVRLITEGQSRHDELVSAAQEQHDSLLAEATQRHDSLLAEATERHDSLLAEAGEERDSMLTGAREQAAGLAAEAEEHRTAVLDDLEGRRLALESAINGLRHHESSYRSRLLAYMQDALVELETQPSVEAGVPAFDSVAETTEDS